VNGRLIVAGPATRLHLTSARGTTFGVRFRIGAAGAALGLPAAELLDLSVPLEDVWADAHRIAESATNPHALAAAIVPRATQTDSLVRAAATGTPRQALGIGDRQLRRRFLDAVGYGPKTLERILRFQRFLALAERHDDLAWLALEAGYADQAHLTRECTRLAGLPPAQLLAEGAGPAGERSVSFKTDATAPATMAA
jgi:AraC-like DNA-binding protein